MSDDNFCVDLEFNKELIPLSYPLVLGTDAARVYCMYVKAGLGFTPDLIKNMGIDEDEFDWAIIKLGNAGAFKITVYNDCDMDCKICQIIRDKQVIDA